MTGITIARNSDPFYTHSLSIMYEPVLILITLGSLLLSYKLNKVHIEGM